jgi:hypothetical protein
MRELLAQAPDMPKITAGGMRDLTVAHDFYVAAGRSSALVHHVMS